MKRNITTYAQLGRKKIAKKQGYDLTIPELHTIYGTPRSKDDLYEMIYEAYCIGFETGCRYTKRKEV